MTRRLMLCAATSGAPVGFKDALLPTLPRLASFTASPDTLAAVTQQVAAAQAAYTGPARGKLCEVVLAPGTYTTGLPQGWVLVRSATGNPADVIIESAETSGGVLHCFMGRSWYRGLTLRSLTNPSGGTGPKYPLHVTGGGGTISFIDCLFDSQNAHSDGGPATIGLDAGDGLSLSFVGCEFRNLGGIVSNIHGGATGPRGVVIAFYHCQSVPPAANEIGFGATQPTDLYYIGGNIVPGVLSGGAVSHTDGWPAPVGGFQEWERIALGI